MQSAMERGREELQHKEIPAYATIIPRRTTKGTVALHTRLAHARNAVSAQGFGYPRRYAEAEVYELKDGNWRLLYRIEHGATTLPWQLPK